MKKIIEDLKKEISKREEDTLQLKEILKDLKRISGDSE